MHKQLLTEDKLTLSRAVQISTGMETAAKSAKGFQESDYLTVKQVGQTFHQPRRQTQFRGTQQPQHNASRQSMPSCKHCGKSNHNEADCRLRQANCHKGALAYRVSSLPKYFVFASLCSFVCLQAVYQLSGPVCKATWNGCPSQQFELNGRSGT